MSENTTQNLQQNMHAMLTEKLSQGGYQIDISEVHGLLCGLACQGIEENNISHYSQLMQLDDDDGKLIIEGLYSLILRDLKADDSSFQLLLPKEDDNIVSLIEGTADWANGFVQGILHNNEQILTNGNETTRECIEDMLEISQMDSDLGDAKNDAKTVNQAASDLAQVEEYLRVNVQLMFLDAQQNIQQHSTQPTSSSTH